jgi:hypothetical protein
MLTLLVANPENTISEFFSQISTEKVFLEQVHKSDKYSGESVKAFAF